MHHFVRTARFGLLAALLAAPLAGRATAVDMTTLNQFYDSDYWTEVATTNSLTITRTGAPMTGDGPHNMMTMGSVD